MRNIDRGAAALVLVVLLAATPVAGATRSPGPAGILQSIKRFIVRVASRVSPPVGSPTQAPAEPTPTDPPAEETKKN